MSNSRYIWEDCAMESFTYAGHTAAEIATALGVTLKDNGRLVKKRGLLGGEIVGEVYSIGDGKTVLRIESKHVKLVETARRLFQQA